MHDNDNSITMIVCCLNTERVNITLIFYAQAYHKCKGHLSTIDSKFMRDEVIK